METQTLERTRRPTHLNTRTVDLPISIDPRKKPKESFLPNLTMDDERTDYMATKNVLIPLRQESSDPINATLQQDFDYLAATRNLEFNTQRTGILENIGKKMLEGQDTQIRIVIMNKGLEKEAFTYPEGTIFISQSLLNELETMDEIGAVIGHEITHLTLDTSGTIRKNQGARKFGVQWSHEIACDFNTVELLEKTGLNSLAFASAIEKVSGNERGFQHQSGLSRASYNVGRHLHIHSETSSKPLTEMPEVLKYPAKDTNLNIAIKLLKDNSKRIPEIIPLLSPQDLSILYKDVLTSKLKGVKRDTLVMIEEGLLKQIRKDGLTKEQSIFFLLALRSTLPVREFELPKIELVTEPNELIAIMHAATSMSKEEFTNAYEKVFDQKLHYSPLDLLLISTGTYLLPLDGQWPSVLKHKISSGDGIPVTKDSLLQTLRVLVDRADATDPIYSINERIMRILDRYISRAGLSDKDKITFLNKAIETYGIQAAKYILENIRLAKKREEQKEPQPIQDPREKWATLSDTERLGRLLSHYDELKEMQSQQEPKNTVSKPFELFYKSSLLAINSFREDSEEFYQFTKLITDDFLNNTKDISFEQLTGLAKPYLEIIDCAQMNSGAHINLQTAIPIDKDNFLDLQGGFSTGIVIKDYGKYYEKLPVFELLRNSNKRKDFKTFSELQTYWKTLLQIYHGYSIVWASHGSESPFSDSFSKVVSLQPIRQAFNDLLSQQKSSFISKDDHKAFIDLIQDFYVESPRRESIIKSFHMGYLKQEDLSTEEKSAYILEHFDHIGIEGVLMVADETSNLNLYKQFRTKLADKINGYLSGSLKTSLYASADYVTSRYTQHFSKLLKTISNSPAVQQEASTDFASEWLKRWKEGIFNPQDGRFEINYIHVPVFQSISDTIRSLQELTEFQRFSVAHKLLLDKDGAFSSEENKQVLTKYILDGLQIKKGFVHSVITKGLLNGDPKFLGFPIAKMLSPLLFKALNTGSINTDKLARLFKEKPLTKAHLETISKARTEEIKSFGATLRRSPDSQLARLTEESETLYLESLEILDRLFAQSKQDNRHFEKTPESPPGLDVATESVIQGLEATGALGVRSLQLATQLHQFSPAVERRLKQTFDSNPGLNKLFLWENIFKLTEGDPEFKKFIEGLEINDYLGGGSLYTVYDATVKDTGQEIVLKILNPNAQAFVEQSYRIANQTLGEVMQDKQSSARTQEYASMGLTLIDLAQNWCIKDINDPTFLEDDRQFRTLIDRFNHNQQSDTFYAPELVYTSGKIKAETKASGKTLNQVLEDPSIDVQTKKEVLAQQTKFFIFQLENTMEDGEHLIHSDPHIGNYVVDLSENQIKMGVIDRNMYLRLSKKDMDIITPLLQDDYNARRFLSSFIDRVSDINKERGLGKTKTKTDIFIALLKEHGIRANTANKFALLKTVLAEFEKKKMHVPLELQLMIRNITAQKELLRRYGMKLEDFVGKAA